MIGIIVVSHGKFAKELVAAAEHVVGRQKNFRAISIEPDDDMEDRRTQIIETAKSCEMGAGVIILTDMFGGTPSNLAISVMGKGKIEVIAGVNLPMLIKLAGVRDKLELAEAAETAVEAGKKYISVASQVLEKKGS